MKKLPLLAVIITAVVFVQSCRKQDVKDVSLNQENSKISAFLKQEALKTTAYRGKIVKSLSENLNWQQKKVVQLSNERKITVVPISEAFKNDNNSTKKVLNVLVISENTRINKMTGNIYQYIVTNESNTLESVLNSVIEINKTNKSLIDGHFTVLNLSDIYLKDLYFKNGILDEVRYLTSKNNAQRSNSNCTGWYYVVYNTATGEIISSTYLYTSCDCNEVRTNPENGRIEDPENCHNGGGSEQAFLNELQAGLNELWGSPVLRVDTYKDVYVNTYTNKTYIVDFQSAYAARWSVDNKAQFVAKKNSNNTIFAQVTGVSTVMNTNFGALDATHKGEYIPNPTTLPDNIDANNTYAPQSLIIRQGIVKVYVAVPGFNWVNFTDNCTGSLMTSFHSL